MSVERANQKSSKKPKTYHSPRRAEQAAATRAAIIDAASQLFAERGYAATTMAAIAQAARVATKSVYTLGEKRQLLLLAVDKAIVGDDQPVPLADRPEIQGITGAVDPAEQVRLAASYGAQMLTRLYPLYRAFEQAAAAEPELGQDWRDYQLRRREDAAHIVHAINATTPLRPGLTVDRATDTLWALITWHPVMLLVEERGWTEADLTAWLQDLLATLLLPP